MDLSIRDFTIQDYDIALELWKADPNIGLSSADDKKCLARFLERNPGLSKVALEDDKIVATVLCGHDGRRGFIYHMYVKPEYRRNGIGKELVKLCMDNLHQEGIQKCALFVMNSNDLGQSFWNGIVWKKRDDIAVFSREV